MTHRPAIPVVPIIRVTDNTAADHVLSEAKKLSVAGELCLVDEGSKEWREGDAVSSNENMIISLMRQYPSSIRGLPQIDVDEEAILKWLDVGVTAVMCTEVPPPHILDKVPQGRMVMVLSHERADTTLGMVKEVSDAGTGCHILLEFNTCPLDVECVRKCSQLLGVDKSGFAKLRVGGNAITKASEVRELDEMGITTYIDAERLLDVSGPLNLGTIFASLVESDRPDGLYTTLVSDSDGVALGLCYSNDESIVTAINESTGVYHSRKRGLWRKGATSGATQELLRVALDCDRDCLLYAVRQKGDGFCHQNSWTCFGEDRGIGRLMRTLADRRRDAPEGSYTKRLFDDSDLLQSKLLEEAQELIDAHGDAYEAAWECADVLYFAFVAAVRDGVNLDDVARQLERRTIRVRRRAGNKKPSAPTSAPSSGAISKVARKDYPDWVTDRNNSPLSFVRPDLFSLTYSPVKPLDVLAKEIGIAEKDLVKLDANENVYGPHEAVVNAMTKTVNHVYPDPTQVRLREAIGRAHGLDPGQIVCGAGSDDNLDIIIRLIDTNAVIFCPPTFGMYSFLSKLNSKKIVPVPRKSDFSVDVGSVVAAIRAEKAKVVFLPSPNNPTGTVLSNDDILTLCREDAVIVIDEAYAEFSQESALDVLSQCPNLVVLRTFSKWAGLAGVRVGYSMSHPDLARMMMSIKQPYNVNVSAEAAAVAAMENRDAVLSSSVRLLRSETERLYSLLKEISWLNPIPSKANFVLTEVIGHSAEDLAGYLRKRGILIRFFGTQGGDLKNYIRISAGRPEDTNKVMGALLDFAAEKCDGHKSIVSLSNRGIEAVLFDMDGVLADVSKSYRACIVETAAHFGVTVSGDDIQKAKAAGDANNDWILTRRLIEDGLADSASVPTLDAVTEKFEELYQGTDTTEGLYKTESLMIDKDLLRSLSSKYRMGIVTGRPRSDAEKFLNDFGIRDIFETMACMKETMPKPDPAPARMAMEALNCTTGILIGDTVDDVRCAVRNDTCKVYGIGCIAPNHDTGVDTKLLSSAGALTVLPAGLDALRELC